jgi:hypothetical protein
MATGSRSLPPPEAIEVMDPGQAPSPVAGLAYFTYSIRLSMVKGVKGSTLDRT